MNVNQLMKQAKKMQQELAKKQEELASKVFEVQTGGGMVTAKVNGKHEVIELKIDPEIVKEGDVEMIQDLVVAAINEGFERVQEELQSEMAGMMGGVPGMGDMGGF